jgi:hypothetical protein
MAESVAQELYMAEGSEIGRGRDAPSDQGMPEFAQERSQPSPRIRFPADFPGVVIQQPDSSPLRVRAHPDYPAAKGGDTEAALRLLNYSLDPAKVGALQRAIGDRHPIVVAVHAEEAAGRNKIPQAYAETLAHRLGLKTDDAIVVANRPMRTGARGLYRIMTRAGFDGPVEAGRDYLIVDDHVSQGGTLADLRSFIRERGGNVIGATTLTGNDKRATLAPLPSTLARLRERFPGLEPWWKEHFGHGFDGLTQSEAAYLDRYSSADSIRNTVLARGQEARLGADEGTPRPTGKDGS